MKVEQIKSVLRDNRGALVDFAVERIRATVEGYASVPAEALNRDVGTLVDAVVETVGMDDASAIYQHQLQTAQQRIERGVTLQQYLRATLLGFPIMRAFAAQAGLPFEPIEKALIALVINSGEAYTRAYDARVKKLQAERERLRALSELVAGVAHEINTPLGIIVQATSMVSGELVPDEIPNIARDADAEEMLVDIADAFLLIQKNVGRVSNLVKSFKNLSIHQYTDEVDELDLHEIASGAAASYRTRSGDGRKVDVQIIDQRKQLERPWHGHGAYLHDIVLGLLTNVERYAYDQHGTATIELSDRGDDGVRIVVADEGRGMTGEHIAKAFNPFFTTGRSIGACGLGLAIVHNLVTHAMAGTVEVDSAEGRGTRVVLDLPWEV